MDKNQYNFLLEMFCVLEEHGMDLAIEIDGLEEDVLVSEYIYDLLEEALEPPHLTLVPK